MRQELCAFANALAELVQTPEIETFWDLELSESEKFAADMLAIVLRHLEVHGEALSAAIASTASVAKRIDQKRDVRACDRLCERLAVSSD